MNATLKVKNFGPIKDVELDLRDVNVFIGPQASGKSVLAKLYTICKSPSLFCEKEVINFPLYADEEQNLLGWFNFNSNKLLFEAALNKFSLQPFLTDKSEILFSSEDYHIILNTDGFFYIDNLQLEIGFSPNEGDASKYLNESLELIKGKSKFIEDSLYENQVWSQINIDSKSDDVMRKILLRLSILKKFKNNIFHRSCNYIPSERTLAVLLKKAALNLMHQRVPIPEHLLEFAANYNTASDKIKNLDLSYLKSSASYKNIDGEDFILDDGTTLKLSESASGLQSVVPLLLTLENLKNSGEESAFHQAFVIEEPETNLFPKAQYALLKYLERNRPDDDGKIDTGSVHIYTTHSPFILSSLNNMLYAYKKGNSATPSIQEEISKILPKENWISPERFSAYQIVDGKAESIFDRESGLIQENIIDQISDDIIEDFRSIAIATMES